MLGVNLLLLLLLFFVGEVLVLCLLGLLWLVLGFVFDVLWEVDE